MILGDLLDSRVLGHDGGRLGHVVDVRLALELRDEETEPQQAQDDPPALAHGARRHDAVGRAEVLGLLVSRRPGSFLGYERTGVRSPWLIATLMRARHRGTFLVAWAQVSEIGDGTVTLAEGFERLDPGLT
jgi:sporulation protein YlmC with PRC-barrel domain